MYIATVFTLLEDTPVFGKNLGVEVGRLHIYDS